MNAKLAVLFPAVLMFVSHALAVQPSRAELAKAHAWALQKFTKPWSKDNPAPFSFLYGGRPSSDLIPNWPTLRTSRKLDKARTEYVIALTEPETKLVVTCRAIEYQNFPTVEWTLTFGNEGTADSPILEEIRPLDVGFQRSLSSDYLFHYNTADNCTQDSYAPHVRKLRPGDGQLRFASAGGRPTTGAYPYWNLEFNGGGVIVVLSWGGQWSADAWREEPGPFRIRGGQELPRFRLHAGEEVSSPMGIVQFYEGEWMRGQNIWRRWMRAHNTPHFNGKPQGPMYYMNANGYFPGYRSSFEDEKQFLLKFVAEGLPVGYWDLDAGWYPCDRYGWPETGTWDPDPKRFPNGIKPLSDLLHQNKAKLILWFEPERTADGTWLSKNHPEWIHGGAGGGLVKLDNPDAAKWITEKVSAMVDSQGIDVYRQDFNIDPLNYWRSADVANGQVNRQGMTELRHIEAYYKFWDTLRARHPNLLIDTCASGGRRNNVETLRRSVPILRSDYTQEPIGCQGHTYGLSMWVPLAGTGVFPSSQYLARSCFAPIFGMAYDVRVPGQDWERMRACYRDWERLAPFMLADYWPITPYSLEKTAWIGWQWDRPEGGDGMVQAFRRENSSDLFQVLKLRGLAPSLTYLVTNFDTGSKERHSGKELMEKGLRISIPERPGSAMIGYEKVR